MAFIKKQERVNKKYRQNNSEMLLNSVLNFSEIDMNQFKYVDNA